MQSFKDLLLYYIYFPQYKHNLGKSRKEMPQIFSENHEQFLEYLSQHNIDYKKVNINPYDIIPTQKEFNSEKVEKYVNKPVKEIINNTKFIISKDNYLLDGHHRIAALNKLNVEQVEVLKVNVLMFQLLTLAKTFEKVNFRDIHEAKTIESFKHLSSNY